MTLRIAHISDADRPSGLSSYILEIGSIHQHTRDVKQFFMSSPRSRFSHKPKGKCDAEEQYFHDVEKRGFTVCRIQHDMPHLIATTFEYIRLLKQHNIQLVCAHGHKPRILGWFAAKRLGIPIIAVSHGWTGAGLKMKLFECIDKWMHRLMDHVVCVSQAQADKVIRYGTPPSRVSVIYNSIRTDRFDVRSNISFRHQLEAMFPKKPKWIVGAAGRLSLEKGYDILITAAKQLLHSGLDIGFVLFGDGSLYQPLQKQVDDAGIASSFVLTGQRTDQLDQYMPHFDLFAQSSHTEGMPTVLLEAMAARTAVVATQVGGTGELVVEGSTGLMVPPNNPDALANAIRKVLNDDELRRTMGENGRQQVAKSFNFEPQAEKYWELFCRLLRTQNREV